MYNSRLFSLAYIHSRAGLPHPKVDARMTRVQDDRASITAWADSLPTDKIVLIYTDTAKDPALLKALPRLTERGIFVISLINLSCPLVSSISNLSSCFLPVTHGDALDQLLDFFLSMDLREDVTVDLIKSLFPTPRRRYPSFTFDRGESFRRLFSNVTNDIISECGRRVHSVLFSVSISDGSHLPEARILIRELKERFPSATVHGFPCFRKNGPPEVCAIFG